MKRKYANFTSLIVVMVMIISVLGGCKKDENDGTQSTGSISKSATAAKTTAKSTETAKAKATTSASVSSASASPSSQTSSSTDAGAAGSSTQQEEKSYAVETVSGEKIDIVLDTVSQEEIFDLGGKTLILSCWSNAFSTGSLSEEKNPIFRNRLKAAEKKYNFKFELDERISDMAAWDKAIISASLAGVNYADIIRTQAIKAIPNYAKNNIIIPLDDYIDFNTPLMKANVYQDKGTMYNGKHWGIANGDSKFPTPEVMFNNKILQQEGLPNILDLVESEQWTWEALLDIAKSCTKDINGDGVIDQWGIMTNTAGSLAQAVLASNGCTVVEDLGNGHEFALNSAPAMRALQFASELSLVHKVVKVNQNDYKKGIGAIHWGYNQFWRNPEFITAGIESSLACLPMGPDVDTYQNVFTVTMTCISALSEYPREAAIIMNEIYTYWDENLDPIPEIAAQIAELEKQGTPYWQQLSRSYCLTEREYLLGYVTYGKTFKPDYTNGYPNVSTLVTNNIANPIMNGQKSVSQALSSAKDQIQDIINQYK